MHYKPQYTFMTQLFYSQKIPSLPPQKRPPIVVDKVVNRKIPKPLPGLELYLANSKPVTLLPRL
jgi:hypothetical protein